MASTANGTAHHESEPAVSWPVGPGLQNSRPDPLGQINAGGISWVPEFSSPPAVFDETRSRFDKQYLPGQLKSLAGIATRAFFLGFALSSSLISAFYLVLFTGSPLWRLPSFLAALSLFHFLEFWTTAQYNTRSAQISSFLLSHTISLTRLPFSNAWSPI